MAPARYVPLDATRSSTAKRTRTPPYCATATPVLPKGKRLKDLEWENSTLKGLLADAELENAALKEIARGSF